jgi:hypothetical protein
MPMEFWFGFSLWPRILGISSYIYWPFVLLLRIVCSFHLPIYSVGSWFSEVSFGYWSLVIYSWQIFFLFCKLSLQSGDHFPCFAEAF